MEQLRSVVERTARVLAVRVPAPLVGPVRARLAAVRMSPCDDDNAPSRPHGALCSVPHAKAIVCDPEDARMRLILLSEAIRCDDVDEQALPRDALPEQVREILRNEEERHQVEFGVAPYALRVGIENMSVPEILRAALPAGIDPPASFETAGHLAHLNLRDDAVPHAGTIAAAIMAKNAHIRAVVNKTGVIEGEFRVFPMTLVGRRQTDGSFDLCAQQPTAEDTVVAVREGGCVFELDFARVYWNSRLQAEHARLVSMLGKGAVLVDMFCGVGPFALPAAKAGATVFANDLNPESVRWLVHNAARNKVCIRHVSCADARVFVRRLFGPDPSASPATTVRDHSAATETSSPDAVQSLVADAVQSSASDAAEYSSHDATDSVYSKQSSAQKSEKRTEGALQAQPSDADALPGPTFDTLPPSLQDAQWHFVMNLPAAAHEFLDVLADLPAAMHRARVHCYVFCRTAPSVTQPGVEDPVEKCEAVFGRALLEPFVHRVRDVAPGKEMFCVSFTIGTPDSSKRRRV